MNFFDNLMSPLNRNHCSIFYYLGLISFFLAMVALVSLVTLFFSPSKNRSNGAVSALVMSILSNLVMYYFSRIHYSICLAALN